MMNYWKKRVPLWGLAIACLAIGYIAACTKPEPVQPAGANQAEGADYLDRGRLGRAGDDAGCLPGRAAEHSRDLGR